MPSVLEGQNAIVNLVWVLETDPCVLNPLSCLMALYFETRGTNFVAQVLGYMCKLLYVALDISFGDRSSGFYFGPVYWLFFP